MKIQTELAVFVRDLGRAQRDKSQKRKQPFKENRGKRSKKFLTNWNFWIQLDEKESNTETQDENTQLPKG